MKKLIVTFLAMCFGLGSLMAQNAALQGTITGLPANIKLMLREVINNKLVTVDSAMPAANGTYAFHVQPRIPSFYVLELSISKSPNVHVILQPGEKVTLDMRYTPMWNHLRITGTMGSRNMELYRRFNNLIPSGQDEASQWNMKVNVSEMLTEYSDCLMSAFLVTFFEEDFNDYGGLYKLIRDKLIGTYPDNDFVRHLDDKLRTSIVAGMDAPDIAMKDANGNIRKLSDLKGKVVLLDFWASWCGPCRKENPNVVKIYQQFHSQGFEVYSVSLDKSKDAWLKAIRDDGLVWENHVSDLNGWTSSGGRIYGISSVPATILIDRDGKIVARNLRGADLANKVRELIAK